MLNENQLKFMRYCQARREPQRGPRGNILAGPPNIFTGLLWEENFRIFLFKMVHSDVLYISGRRCPPNVAGPGVATPYPIRQAWLLPT